MNHPDVETRLACSTCSDPICTRCMRPAAVGQKCPRCARVPRSARATGRPIHYAKAVAAGLATAIAGGVGLLVLLPVVRFGGIIFSALLGLAVGRAVAWGAHRQTYRPFEVIAVVCAALGAAIGHGAPFGLRGYGALAILAAGYFGLRGLRG